jgi:hypothetical protein
VSYNHIGNAGADALRQSKNIEFGDLSFNDWGTDKHSKTKRHQTSTAAINAYCSKWMSKACVEMQR